MNHEIINSVKSGDAGYYIGSRMILPFKCQLLKLIVDNHIFTEFVGNDHIKMHQDPKNTSIYFRETGKLRNFEGSYEDIKLIVAGLDENLCDRETHLKLICNIEDNHRVAIRFTTKDDLFIE